MKYERTYYTIKCITILYQHTIFLVHVGKGRASGIDGRYPGRFVERQMEHIR